jgi:RNA polymerase sigma-70 factor (ECF subfamily)
MDARNYNRGGALRDRVPARGGLSSRPPGSTDGGADSSGCAPALSLSAEEVVREYGARVYNVVRKMVRNDADAEDVTQDVLLQVVRKLPDFRGESALPTWLHRVAVNVALSHRRKQAHRQESAVGADLADLLERPEGLSRQSRANTPEERLVARETRQLIERAIASLPPAYRSVFILADVEDLPNARIAEQLDLSLPAVKSRLHRARQMLRASLAPHFPGPSAADEEPPPVSRCHGE